MTIRIYNIIKWHRLIAPIIAMAVCAVFLLSPTVCHGETPSIGNAIFDLGRAMEVCDSLPLSGPEGIWMYPEDNVTVLVVRQRNASATQFDNYDITVVETSDCNLRPGETIGRIQSSAETGKYIIELFTERKNGLLMKPHTCSGQISKEGDAIIFKQEKPKFNLRLTLNPYSLLPKFWKIFRLNASTTPLSTSSTNYSLPAVGMIKIYPSYDGNGSSRRRVRYL